MFIGFTSLNVFAYLFIFASAPLLERESGEYSFIAVPHSRSCCHKCKPITGNQYGFTRLFAIVIQTVETLAGGHTHACIYTHTHTYIFTHSQYYLEKTAQVFFVFTHSVLGGKNRLT